MAHLQTDFL